MQNSSDEVFGNQSPSKSVDASPVRTPSAGWYNVRLACIEFFELSDIIANSPSGTSLVV
jgi:hypothetical protein